MLCDDAGVLALVVAIGYASFLVWGCVEQGGTYMDILGPMGGANGTVCGRNFVGAIDSTGHVQCLESCSDNTTQIWMYCVDGPTHHARVFVLGERASDALTVLAFATGCATATGLLHTTVLRATGGAIVIIIVYGAVAALGACAWAVYTGYVTIVTPLVANAVASLLALVAAIGLLVTIAMTDAMLAAARIIIDASAVTCCAVTATVGTVICLAMQTSTAVVGMMATATCGSIGLHVTGVPGSLALRSIEVHDWVPVRHAGTIAVVSAWGVVWLAHVWKIALVRRADQAIADSTKAPSMRTSIGWALTRAAGTAAIGSFLTVVLVTLIVVIRYIYNRSSYIRYHSRAVRIFQACVRCTQVAIAVLQVSLGIIYACATMSEVSICGATRQASELVRYHPLIFAVTTSQLSLVRAAHTIICASAATVAMYFRVGTDYMFAVGVAGIIGLVCGRITFAPVDAAVMSALVRRTCRLTSEQVTVLQSTLNTARDDDHQWTKRTYRTKQTIKTNHNKQTKQTEQTKQTNQTKQVEPANQDALLHAGTGDDDRTRHEHKEAAGEGLGTKNDPRHTRDP